MQEMKSKATEFLADVVEKAAFANHLSILSKATADNKEPTPGYMFREIEAICKLPPPQCQQLIDYLLKRLNKPSADVKIKVLKILLHLIEHADSKFRLVLRRFDSSLKMASMYYNDPDPLTGPAITKEIQQLAHRALENLFDAESVEADEIKPFVSSAENPSKFLGGLGSVNSNFNPAFPGFGNSSVKSDSFRGLVTDLIEKIIEPACDSQKQVISSAMCSSSGDYEPVEIKISDTSSNVPKKPKELLNIIKVHIPGRAGGGWESDDEQRPTPPLSLQYDDKFDPNSSVERDAIQEFCSRNQFPVTLTEIKDICKKCTALSCVQTLQELNNLLGKREEIWISKFRALLILEFLLRTDIFPTPEIVLNMITDGLNVCKEDSDNRVSIKAKKIHLILIALIRELKITKDKSNSGST